MKTTNKVAIFLFLFHYIGQSSPHHSGLRNNLVSRNGVYYSCYYYYYKYIIYNYFIIITYHFFLGDQPPLQPRGHAAPPADLQGGPHLGQDCQGGCLQQIQSWALVFFYFFTIKKMICCNFYQAN